MTSLRLFQRLVGIVVVVAGTVVASSSSSSSQECEVGVDGSCLGSSDSNSISIATDAEATATASLTCIDEHEKCEHWMTKGMCIFVCVRMCVFILVLLLCMEWFRSMPAALLVSLFL